MKVCKKIGYSPGTFDVNDLLFMMVGGLLPIMIELTLQKSVRWKRIKNQYLLLSAALFWLLAIASSPQIGQNVDCDQLPAPETKTYTLNFVVHELEKDPPVKGVTVNIEQKKNLASVKVSETRCKVQVISSSKDKWLREKARCVYNYWNQKSYYDHVQFFEFY